MGCILLLGERKVPKKREGIMWLRPDQNPEPWVLKITSSIRSAELSHFRERLLGSGGLGRQRGAGHGVSETKSVVKTSRSRTGKLKTNDLQGTQERRVQSEGFGSQQSKSLVWTKNRGGSYRATGFVLQVPAAAGAASPSDSLPSGPQQPR